MAVELRNEVMPAIDGHETIRRLGGGATAEVWLCRRRDSGLSIAVKVGLRRADPRQAQRFRDEAAFLARLSAHPNILTVLGSGETADGRPYVALDYAPRGTGKDLMAVRALTPREAADLGVRLAGALVAAHRAGVTHRDIKPSNILFAADGTPMLADFGIAASVYDATTVTGFSARWAAPEVLNGRSGGSEAADLYALAAVIRAMMSGHVPRTASAIGPSVATAMPSDVPDALRRTLERALSEEPSDRPYSALEFARSLQSAQWQAFGTVTPLTAEGEAPFPPQPSGSDAGRDAGRAHAATHPDVPHPRGRVRVAVCAVVLAALAMGAAALTVWHGADSVPTERTVQVPGPSVRPSAPSLPLEVPSQGAGMPNGEIANGDTPNERADE